jgi:cytochrome c biogenesis factor
MLGVWAAILFAAGGSPAPRLWAGGLAVGIITGAVAGAGSRDRGAEGLRDVPGYGLWAFRGGLLSLSMAGIGAVAGLSGGSLWADVAWALALLSLGLMATWSIARPAGNWKRVWVAAGPAAAVTTVVLTAIIGREGLFLAILCGLAVALAVGAAADATRLFRVRRRWRRSAADDRAEISRVVRRRSGRRRASALAHLGLAAIGVGIAAEALTQAESRVLYPGETANLSGWLGADVRVTYLGLSRYQADELEKRVATFKLERGQTGPELVTAEIVQDRKTDLPSRRPAVKSGVLYDTVVSLVDLRAAEGAMFRLAVRPLSWLVWLGGAVLLLSTFARWGRVT